MINNRQSTRKKERDEKTKTNIQKKLVDYDGDIRRKHQGGLKI